MSKLRPISDAPTDGTLIQGFDNARRALGEVYHAFKPGQGVAKPWRGNDFATPVEPVFWLPSAVLGG